MQKKAKTIRIIYQQQKQQQQKKNNNNKQIKMHVVYFKIFLYTFLDSPSLV